MSIFLIRQYDAVIQPYVITSQTERQFSALLQYFYVRIASPHNKTREESLYVRGLGLHYAQSFQMCQIFVNFHQIFIKIISCRNESYFDEISASQLRSFKFLWGQIQCHLDDMTHLETLTLLLENIMNSIKAARQKYLVKYNGCQKNGTTAFLCLASGPFQLFQRKKLSR